MTAVQYPHRSSRKLINARNLRPGGWIEIHEAIPFVSSDDDTADDHIFNEFYRLVEGPFTNTYGWNLRFPFHIVETVRELGFVGIQERRTKIPIGRWHRETRMREMGMFCQSICEDWVSALLTRHEIMGISEQEADRLGHGIYEAFNNPRIHAQLEWIDCWAQKPLS